MKEERKPIDRNVEGEQEEVVRGGRDQIHRQE